MPIKLLPKQEISRLQAEEKRVAIQEGVKLARRVDNLREIAAQEEASLASFRTATLTEIKKQTDDAKSKRDSLLKEVADLRKEIQDGTQVLDIRENVLVSREEDLVKQQKDIETRSFSLKTLTEKVILKEKQLEALEQKLKNTWNVLVAFGKDVEVVYEQATTALNDVQSRAEATLSVINEVNEDLKVRDIAVASRERDVIIKEERVENTRKQLEEREKQLLDRELTLEREFNRLKNRK